MEKTERKPNSPQMDLQLLPPSPPLERRKSPRANKFSGSYYYGKQQVDRQLPTPKLGNRRRVGKAAVESPSSTSKFKNTSTSGKPSPRDEYQMAFRHLVATLPRPEPRPRLNLRRSERSTKFSGRYGYRDEPLPPLHPKLKRFLFITKRECKEFIKDRAPPPPPAGPYVGFGLSAEKIARLEAMRRNDPPKPPQGSRAYVDLDKLVEKYTAEGLSREAVMAAVPIHMHNPTKIPRFANGYTRLREMGFPRDKVINALDEYDDDADKALDYLNNSTNNHDDHPKFGGIKEKELDGEFWRFKVKGSDKEETANSFVPEDVVPHQPADWRELGECYGSGGGGGFERFKARSEEADKGPLPKDVVAQPAEGGIVW